MKKLPYDILCFINAHKLFYSVIIKYPLKKTQNITMFGHIAETEQNVFHTLK